MCIWQKVKQEIAIWRTGAMPGIAVIAIVVLVRLLGGLQFLELTALDNFLRWRESEPKDERIAIIGISEEDIQQLDNYPLSDLELVNLITTLEKYNPAVIGVDIVRDKPQEPGHEKLNQLFEQNSKIIGVEKVLSGDSRISVIKPPPSLPPERVGFVDALLDRDNKLRRSLVSATPPNSDFKFSFTILLAKKYLTSKGISLENAPDDPSLKTMQFADVRLTRITPNTGGYVNTDARGNQILLNFRSGKEPFRILSLEDIKQNNFQPNWIENRIILIGITALSVRDDINTRAVQSENFGFIYGVEIQAHAVSQIISAVLDNRPLLKVWHDGWEYLWIFGWGFLGISLARILSQSPGKLLIAIALAVFIVIVICYLLLLQFCLWLPLVPSVLVLSINGLGLTASMFYRDRQDLNFKLKDRQYTIKYMSSTIHNRPIQTLKQILRQVREKELSPGIFIEQLNLLDEELRNIGELIEKEIVIDGNSITIGNSKVDLQCPLKEILYQVYSHTVVQDLPYLNKIEFKIVNFEDINDSNLTVEQKRSLCRFLEEAILNVGKYAKGATRLKVTCTEDKNRNIIRIEDNGNGLKTDSDSKPKRGGGTKQAQNLAKQLGGEFRRYSGKKKGTVCELTWKINKSWFWHF